MRCLTHRTEVDRFEVIQLRVPFVPLLYSRYVDEIISVEPRVEP